MNLTFRENYWDSPELKQELISFLKEIFGLDLSQWDNLGFWDNNYRPFSLFDGDTLVSNVCVYTMDMTIIGMKSKVAQISAVGTLQEYRRKGLSRELMRIALDWARDKHDYFFLFADEIAYQLYRDLGFHPVDEYKTRISVRKISGKPGAIKLDIQREDDVKLIYNLAKSRESVSDKLGAKSDKLFMYWCLYALKDYIYYVPALDILVLYKRESGLIKIYDIVGPKMPAFQDIYPYICASEDKNIEFLFMTDKFHLENIDYIIYEESGLHIFGNFPLDATKFMFPFTSHA